jgi:hypothetical protein
VGAVADQPAIALFCSFCLKPEAEVTALIAGPGVCICDECVALCQQVMQVKEDESVRQLAPWEQIDDVDVVLANLPRVARAGAQVEVTLTEWVRRGRGLGATWTRIGDALGMTRQSARKRFSGEE